METFFTINGAASLIEKDRRTLVAALKSVKPDAREGRQNRYKMRTIFNALMAHELRAVGRSSGGKIVDEHILLARARREKIERENALAAGKLVHIEVVVEALGANHHLRQCSSSHRQAA